MQSRALISPCSFALDPYREGTGIPLKDSSLVMHLLHSQNLGLFVGHQAINVASLRVSQQLNPSYNDDIDLKGSNLFISLPWLDAALQTVSKPDSYLLYQEFFAHHKAQVTIF